jgi:nucleoside 2-deoxyribosyltransferase
VALNHEDHKMIKEKNTMKVYLAGPITSKNYSGATEWRQNFKETIKQHNPNIRVLSPMRGKYYLKDCKDIPSTNVEKFGILSGGPAVLTRDYADTTTSDIIVVNLMNAQKVSIGTMFEIAWAYSKHIPIVLIIEDDTVNIHSHSMLFAMCGYRVNSFQDAVNVVLNFFNEE